MAPYVRMAFEEEYTKIIKDAKLFSDDIAEMNVSKIKIKDYLFEEPVGDFYARAKQEAINRTVKRVHQAMESFIHNMNTMHSRGGEIN